MGVSGERPEATTQPLKLELDFRSGESVTAQICEQIRRLILSGRLKPGDQLPTVRQLAADLRVNFNTVARAYRTLDEERLISTQHGRGTFVTGPPVAAREDLRREAFTALTERFVAQAAQLGYSPSEIVREVQAALRRQEHATERA